MARMIELAPQLVEGDTRHHRYSKIETLKIQEGLDLFATFSSNRPKGAHEHFLKQIKVSNRKK